MTVGDAPPPLVSCIVPAYNCERYLEEALDSVFAQDHRPIEVVVVDDGSTDGTPEVCARYGERLRFAHQSNAGPAAARNLGLGLARGELVAFQDADDLWHPERLARQIARFRARPELDICLGHVQNIWMPEVADERERYREHRLSRPQPGYLLQVMLARRSVFDRVGLFDAGYRVSSDTEWFFRAVRSGVVIEMLPDVLHLRRLHDGNITLRERALYPEHLFRVLRLDIARGRSSAAAGEDGAG